MLAGDPGQSTAQRVSSLACLRPLTHVPPWPGACAALEDLDLVTDTELLGHLGPLR